MLGEISELRVWCTAVPQETLRARLRKRIEAFGDERDLVACWGQQESRAPGGDIHHMWDIIGAGALTVVPGIDALPLDPLNASNIESPRAKGGASAKAKAAAADARGGGGDESKTAPRTGLTLNRGQSMVIGYTGRLGLTGRSYTVEAWVKFRDYNTDDGEQRDNTILGTDRLRRQQALHIVLRGGKLHMGHYCDDTASTTTQALNEWRHYAFVYDYATTEQRIYVNGELDTSSAGHKPLIGKVPLYIGRYAGTSACVACHVLAPRNSSATASTDVPRACVSCQAVARWPGTSASSGCGARQCHRRNYKRACARALCPLTAMRALCAAGSFRRPG